MQRSILVPYEFVWENAEMVDHSETVEVYDIKVGIHSKLNKYKKIPDVKVVLHPLSKVISNSFFPEATGQFTYWAFMRQGDSNL